MRILVEDWDMFEGVLDHIYDKCLMAESQHHSVLFTEAPVSSSKAHSGMNSAHVMLSNSKGCRAPALTSVLTKKPDSELRARTQIDFSSVHILANTELNVSNERIARP